MASVTVFGSSASRPGETEYDDGVRLGRLLAEAGFRVITGGYGGLMEAVSAGAAQADGEVVGITVPSVFRGREGANPYVSREVRANSLVERIHELTSQADAAIALPGSIGTLTELMVAWNLAYVARFSDRPPLPIVAVGPLWGELVPLLAEKLFTEQLVACVETVEEAAALVRDRLG